MVKLQLASLLACSTLALAVLRPKSSVVQPLDVDVISAGWPESNPFGRITNGASSNLLNVQLHNHAGEEIVITRVYGAFREPHGRERALKNTTTLALQQPVLSGLKSPVIPYKFHSENKQGEIGLRVWVDYLDAGKKVHTLVAFEGTANVVEPKGSWFDPALLFAYVVFGLMLYGLFTLVYSSYIAPRVAPPTSKRTKRGPVTPSVTAAEQPSTIVNGVDSDWIPAHLAHEVKQRKNRGSGEDATSGEESEGGKKKRRGGRK